MKWIYASIKLNEVKIFLFWNPFLPEFSDSPNAKMCDPIIKTLLKMQPNYSQSQSIPVNPAVKMWPHPVVHPHYPFNRKHSLPPTPPSPGYGGEFTWNIKRTGGIHIGENPQIADNWCLNVWLNGDWENWSCTTCELITLSTLCDEIFRLRYRFKFTARIGLPLWFFFINRRFVLSL